MAKPLALITEALNPRCAKWLEQYADVQWCRFDAGDVFEQQLATCQALIVRTYTQVNQQLLDKAPQLKVVARAGVGLDNIDIPACQKRNVQVVSTPEANTQAVVEYVLALMLDDVRPREPFSQAVAADAFHAMRQTNIGLQLDQLTLGIIGFGRIGTRLGCVAHALGMNLLVNDVLPEAALRKQVAYPYDYVDKPALLAKSDIISIHIDGRSDNRQLFGDVLLKHMNPKALLINAARGMLVDHNALAHWAKEHLDARIVLDVHDPEPPSKACPMFGLSNVKMLPHIASRTDTALENMSWVVRDAALVLQGQTPQYSAWD